MTTTLLPSTVVCRSFRCHRPPEAHVQACLQDLETLLSVKRVERGRAILDNPITEIRIHPDGTAEICGDFQGVLSLVSREKFTLVVPGGGFCLRGKPGSGLHSEARQGSVG